MKNWSPAEPLCFRKARDPHIFQVYPEAHVHITLPSTLVKVAGFPHRTFLFHASAVIPDLSQCRLKNWDRDEILIWKNSHFLGLLQNRVFGFPLSQQVCLPIKLLKLSYLIVSQWFHGLLNDSWIPIQRMIPRIKIISMNDGAVARLLASFVAGVD